MITLEINILQISFIISIMSFFMAMTWTCFELLKLKPLKYMTMVCCVLIFILFGSYYDEPAFYIGLIALFFWHWSIRFLRSCDDREDK